MTIRLVNTAVDGAIGAYSDRMLDVEYFPVFFIVLRLLLQFVELKREGLLRLLVL